jgi:hypothetical protein
VTLHRKKPLRAKVGLKPSSKPMKRTPLRKVGKQKRRERATVDPLRRQLRSTKGRCVHCDRAFAVENLECHEIVGGVNRWKAVLDPDLWLVVCRECHPVVQGMSKSAQVALKTKQVIEAVNNTLGRNALEVP